MKNLREIFKISQEEIGIPVMEESFDNWGEDIKAYAEESWTHISELALIHYATHHFINIALESPIEQKMYFALQKKFASDFLNYRSNAKLLVTSKLNVISSFLERKGNKPVFSEGDVDYELDFFLYMDCSLYEHGKKNLRFPFMIGIECDGHQFHERTAEQAKKDKSKDRHLKEKNIDIVRFTGTEITRQPDECAEQVLRLYHKHIEKMNDLLTQIENT